VFTGVFTIDFFEFCFLCASCIPPQPIARTVFWHRITDVYWEIMTEEERVRLFEYLNQDSRYQQGLSEKQGDIVIFHSRFNPDNQYTVRTNFNNKEEEHRAFKMGDNYFVSSNRRIGNEYIVHVEKIVVG